MGKTIYTTIDDQTYDWLDRIRENRKDKTISATIRYLVEKIREIAEKGGRKEAAEFIEEIRRWST